jgi:hypothetical protein
MLKCFTSRWEVDPVALRAALVRSGLNRKELERLSGVSVRTIKSMVSPAETARRGFNPDRVEPICRALNISVDEVVKGDFVKTPGAVAESCTIELATVAVRALERTLILVANRSIHHLRRGGDSIRVRPGHICRFVSSTGQWMHDPLDTLEQSIIETTIVFPRAFRRNRRLMESEIDDGCRELDRLCEHSIRHILTSYGLPKLDILADRRPMDIQPLLSDAAGLLATIGREPAPTLPHFAPYVEKLKEELRETGKPICVEITRGDELDAKVPRAFWRRSKGLWLEEDGDDRKWLKFGPKLTVRGSPPPTCKKTYPLPTSPGGCCIAVACRGSNDTGWRIEGIVPFYEPAHEVRNDASEPLTVFLRMNDERPGDNGVGDVRVTVAISPVVPAPPTIAEG